MLSFARRFSVARISVRETREALGKSGLDKMMCSIDLLFENVGDDLPVQEILALGLLALMHP